MPRARLHRSVRFRATHHYAFPGRSTEENRRIFGETAAPHSHDYTVTVTVGGPMVEGTGFVVDLSELDRILDREITGPLDGADLNVAIPEVAGGEVQPGTEALARIFFERLEPLIPGDARLERVRVAESEELAAEYARVWPARDTHG